MIHDPCNLTLSSRDCRFGHANLVSPAILDKQGTQPYREALQRMWRNLFFNVCLSNHFGLHLGLTNLFGW